MFHKQKPITVAILAQKATSKFSFWFHLLVQHRVVKMPKHMETSTCVTECQIHLNDESNPFIGQEEDYQQQQFGRLDKSNKNFSRKLNAASCERLREGIAFVNACEEAVKKGKLDTSFDLNKPGNDYRVLVASKRRQEKQAYLKQRGIQNARGKRSVLHAEQIMPGSTADDNIWNEPDNVVHLSPYYNRKELTRKHQGDIITTMGWISW